MVFAQGAISVMVQTNNKVTARKDITSPLDINNEKDFIRQRYSKGDERSGFYPNFKQSFRLVKKTKKTNKKPCYRTVCRKKKSPCILISPPPYLHLIKPDSKVISFRGDYPCKRR